MFVNRGQKVRWRHWNAVVLREWFSNRYGVYVADIQFGDTGQILSVPAAHLVDEFRPVN